MKACIDCIPCFFEQAIRAGRMATKDDELIKKITDQLGLMLSEISLDNSPPEIGRLIYKKVSEISGNPDPYHQLKFDCTKQALELYQTLERMVKKSNDPLLTAIRLAIAGNVKYNIENISVSDLQKVVCRNPKFNIDIRMALLTTLNVEKGNLEKIVEEAREKLNFVVPKN